MYKEEKDETQRAPNASGSFSLPHLRVDRWAEQIIKCEHLKSSTMEIWKYEDVEIWKYENLTIWTCESIGEQSKS